MDDYLTGELTVSKDGDIEIVLMRKPIFVEVKFEHQHHHHHPCDPDDIPEVHHSVERRHRHYVLKIFWTVNQVEEIIWKAYF